MQKFVFTKISKMMNSMNRSLYLYNSVVKSAAIVLLFMNMILIPIARAESVPVWTYHTAPPYVVDQESESGLTYDFADLLTARSNGKYEFEVEVLPRPRVDAHLSNKDQGVVFWVNNKWFKDPEKSKYLWSSAIISGSASVISPKSNPVEYERPESLLGKELAIVRGRRYVGVDELVEQGLISRKQVNSEESLVRFISGDRAEVSILAQSSASYYVNKLGLEEKVHFSTKPHSQFDRYVLVAPTMEHVLDFIESTAKGLDRDVQWEEILKKYGLDNNGLI